MLQAGGGADAGETGRNAERTESAIQAWAAALPIAGNAGRLDVIRPVVVAVVVKPSWPPSSQAQRRAGTVQSVATGRRVGAGGGRAIDGIGRDDDHCGRGAEMASSASGKRSDFPRRGPAGPNAGGTAAPTSSARRAPFERTAHDAERSGQLGRVAEHNGGQRAQWAHQRSRPGTGGRILRRVFRGFHAMRASTSRLRAFVTSSASVSASARARRRLVAGPAGCARIHTPRPMASEARPLRRSPPHARASSDPTTLPACVSVPSSIARRLPELPRSRTRPPRRLRFRRVPAPRLRCTVESLRSSRTMDLSAEVYQLVVAHIPAREDLCALACVSRSFQRAAERAIYNTLHMRDAPRTVALCMLLAATPRLAAYVEALALFVGDDDDGTGNEDADMDSDGSSYSEEDGSASESQSSHSDSEDSSVLPSAPHAPEPMHLPTGYWLAVASALRATTRLRFLNIFLGARAGDVAQAWILDRCAFRLHTLHCDLAWDTRLAAFLARQDRLKDLYIADFRADVPVPAPVPVLAAEPSPTPPEPPDPVPVLPVTSPFQVPLFASGSQHPSPPTQTSCPGRPPLPALAILECTFTEAACALVPCRPVTHLKTCLSADSPPAKRAELARLMGALARGRARLRALDIADAAYNYEDEDGDEDARGGSGFRLEVLTQVVRSGAPFAELRYLGTLVLPVRGLDRLRFYGLLMRLPHLRTAELEVSDWAPSPTAPPALRSLAMELRLYVPSVRALVFVADFERFVVRAVGPTCRYDPGASTESIWRDA